MFENSLPFIVFIAITDVKMMVKNAKSKSGNS